MIKQPNPVKYPELGGGLEGGGGVPDVQELLQELDFDDVACTEVL